LSLGVPARIALVTVYALTSSQSAGETLDLFLAGEAAEAELREILQDEPDWKDVLQLVPIELDERNVSVIAGVRAYRPRPPMGVPNREQARTRSLKRATRV
jgi:hypothetical protein